MRLPHLALASIALAFSLATPGRRSAEARAPAQPVVVELFTAEGCSACPPADALLDRLAHDQPVAGAEVIALELHVDYFDRPGKADPFAQAAFSARQAEYIRSFGKRGAYTPQMVIDGGREVVGARDRETHDAVADAARAPKAKVVIARDGDKLTITVDGLADVGGSDSASLWLALTEEGLTSRDGTAATAVHGPVVRDLRRVSSVAGGASAPVIVKDLDVAMDASWRRDKVRAVAFVQRDKSLQIVGAGAISMR